VWESLGDVGFSMSEKVWREKKRKESNLYLKYNGSLSLTMLERATIIKQLSVTVTELYRIGLPAKRRQHWHATKPTPISQDVKVQ